MTHIASTTLATSAGFGRHRRRGRLSAGLRRWLHTRRSVATLDRLPDHLLRDIGIRRDQIAGVVQGSADAAVRLSWR